MKPRSKEKRSAILAAALEVVSERGYFETTMDEVARRAEVAKGTLYLYFKDKPAIFIGLVDWLLEQALEMLEEVAARRLPAREKLAAVIRGWSAGVMSRPGVLAMMSMDSVHQSTVVMKRFRHDCLPHFERMLDGIAAIVDQGVRAGEFRRTEPRLAAMMVMGGFRATVLVAATGRPVADPAGAVLEVLFDGLLARPAGGRSSKRRKQGAS